MTDPLSREDARILSDLADQLGTRRPVRPTTKSVWPIIFGLIAFVTLYPIYGATMLAMEAALFLDMPFRAAWDRIWVRWLLFISFCYVCVGVGIGLKRLIKWVAD